MKRLLLVEDHADTLAFTARLLRRKGYDVSTAQTKAEALLQCEQKDFDLLIGDIGLSDGCGLDLMRDIAAKCGIKGIAYTGYGMEEDLQRSRAAGFSAHLVKPIDINDLFETIETVLSQN